MLVRVNRSRGTVTLPKAIRKDVDLYEAVRRQDGVIELRPQVAVDADQAWFWTERWQMMEREAGDDISVGRLARFDDVEALLADLHE